MSKSVFKVPGCPAFATQNIESNKICGTHSFLNNESDSCVRACVRACVRVCMRACVRASVRVINNPVVSLSTCHHWFGACSLRWLACPIV